MLSLFSLIFAAVVGPPQLRFVVNIPAYRLEAFLDDSLVKTVAIAPGMPRYRTPRGTFAITRIEWNPWWIPPKSPWAAKEKITPPGPDNPMGKVKLNFDELYFVHGSPFVQSIGTAASHGCIRVKNEDAIDLARLVHHFGSRDLSPEDVERFIVDTATRDVAIQNPIPVDVRYDLVEVRGQTVSVYRDVYGLATHSLRDETYAALSTHAIDTMLVDGVRVRAFLKNIPRAGRSVPADSLMQRRSP